MHQKARNPQFTFANWGFQLSSGGRIRTYDLWVMSPASYRAAPPRDGSQEQFVFVTVLCNGM